MAAKIKYLVLREGFYPVAEGKPECKIYKEGQHFFGPTGLKGSWFTPEVLHQVKRKGRQPSGSIESDESEEEVE